MRCPIAFTLLIFLGPPTDAAGPPTPAHVAEKLEKAGAKVTADQSMTGAAGLRVSFATLDDKTAAVLRNCPHIVCLTVDDAAKVTDRTLAVIGTLSDLRELTLTQPAMTNSGLAHLKGLKGLRKLFLFNAKVSDSGVTYLKGLDDLEELDLSGSAITSAAASTFKELSGLKVLAVSKTRFGDAGAEKLKDLKDLKELDAVNTDLTVKGAQSLEAAIPGIRVRR
jgi:Leucine rich repeat